MIFFWFLIGILIFAYVLLFGLEKVTSKYPKLKGFLFKSLPQIILILTLIYGIVSIIKLNVYIENHELTIETLISISTKEETYTTLVNFFALLTFYQLLIDRNNKIFSKEFIKISTLDVITRDVYNQNIKAIEKEHNKTVKQLKKEMKKLRNN